MKIQTLSLRNFRNYENETIQFHPHLNLLVGFNAQGKTNLLESLVYLSLTRSHRLTDEKKLIRDELPFADIQCIYEDNEQTKELEAIIHGRGKTLLVNKVSVSKSSEFIGQLNVVLFAPDDLKIFSDQPRARRRIMNQEITKINTTYLSALNASQNLLKERNMLLKNRNVDEIYLDTLDERLSQAETMIVEQRNKFSSFISDLLPKIYKELSMSEDEVKVEYKSCIDSFENINDSIRFLHKESRQKDMENYMTTTGVHREDLIFKMNEKNLIQTASQGQKRMTMLAFKLALLHYIQEVTKKQPILLLDDVLSELDIPHQRKLLEMVEFPYQCIITATEIPEYLSKKEMKEFVIDHGKIREMSGGNI